jgi:pimeloyl-ACP methyl ester carboxylesterase
MAIAPTMTILPAIHRGGSGTPLVLLHGFTVSWRAWTPVLPALEAAHDVIAPTLAGHNGAATLADGQPPNVRSLTDVLEAQLDELGIADSHVVGNSLGGWVALELARRGRARSVVALSPAGAARNERDLRRLHRLVEINQRLMVLAGPRTQHMLLRPRFRRWTMRLGFEQPERFPASEIPVLFEDLAACTIFAALTDAIRQEGMIDSNGLADISCPVRIAWAEHDRVIPFERYGQPLLDMMPQAEHVTLKGCGHGCMFDDPELVVRTILEVTQAVDRNAAT